MKLDRKIPNYYLVQLIWTTNFNNQIVFVYFLNVFLRSKRFQISVKLVKFNFVFHKIGCLYELNDFD